MMTPNYEALGVRFQITNMHTFHDNFKAQGNKVPFVHGYYITAELRVKDEGRIQEAKESLIRLCKETLKEPGCTLFTLHHDTKQPTRFLLWERFDDEAAFKLHFEASHTKVYVAKDLTEVVQYFQTDVAQ